VSNSGFVGHQPFCYSHLLDILSATNYFKSKSGQDQPMENVLIGAKGGKQKNQPTGKASPVKKRCSDKPKTTFVKITNSARTNRMTTEILTKKALLY